MAPDLAQQIAIHEAGHVVAATHSGLTVIGVTVRPGHETKLKENLRDEASVGVMVATAGVVAESRLHDPTTEEEPSGPDDDTRFNAWSRWGGDVGGRPEQSSAYESAHDAAADLMDSHEGLVKAVASVIRAVIDGNGHTLEGAQLATDTQVIDANSSCAVCSITFG